MFTCPLVMISIKKKFITNIHRFTHTRNKRGSNGRQKSTTAREFSNKINYFSQYSRFLITFYFVGKEKFLSMTYKMTDCMWCLLTPTSTCSAHELACFRIPHELLESFPSAKLFRAIEVVSRLIFIRHVSHFCFSLIFLLLSNFFSQFLFSPNYFLVSFYEHIRETP